VILTNDGRTELRVVAKRRRTAPRLNLAKNGRPGATDTRLHGPRPPSPGTGPPRPPPGQAPEIPHRRPVPTTARTRSIPIRGEATIEFDCGKRGRAVVGQQRPSSRPAAGRSLDIPSGERKNCLREGRRVPGHPGRATIRWRRLRPEGARRHGWCRDQLGYGEGLPAGKGDQPLPASTDTAPIETCARPGLLPACRACSTGASSTRRRNVPGRR